MLLQASQISKSFSGKEILNNCSIQIEEREKCALVGANGAGKTTMLRIIMGDLSADEGRTTLRSGATRGYLSQLETVNSENTLYEEILSVKRDLVEEEMNLRILEQEMKHLSGDALETAMSRYAALTHDFEERNGYAVKSEVTGILKGLGFTEADFEKQTGTLSGGQKTRLALGKLLLSKPDLIILDEPTNHLDMASIEWLENFLRNYPGAVLVVAHDRYFLDRIVTRVFELEGGKCTAFTGNYSAYAEKKQALRSALLKAWYKEQAEIRHQEAVIAKLRQFNREKSIRRAESREKKLDKMERMEKPEDLENAMRLTITPSITSGNDVLMAEGLSKSFPGTPLFQDLSFSIRRGERVALIGVNGAGKTTLLKILTGNSQADEGFFRTGVNVHIGYYDQEHQVLHEEKTLFNEISDTWPDMNNTRIRSTLAAFLFTGDDVYKQVKDLSGGERGRLSLAKLMLSKANFLILDEPTNHLDITSREILEQALISYEGTVLYVSHDRYFINHTATRILDLEDGSLVNYIGNYDYYLEKKNEAASLRETPGKSSPWEKVTDRSGEESSNKQSWEEKKAEQARIRKITNGIRKTEEAIDRNEKRSAEIDALLSEEEIARDAEKCAALAKEQAELAAENEKLLEEWERLQEELEN